MNYTFLGKTANGNSRYKVTLNVYRDCFQSDVPLDDNIPIGIYLNNANKDRYRVYDFNLTAKYKVEPPGSVDCDFYAQNVCIEYGLYEGVIEVPEYTEGYHITFVRCCRNRQENLPDQAGTPFQGQTYYAFIPNTSYENNSPVFSGVPSPYMCSNDTTSILFSAVDPDGDELSYRIVRPYQGGAPTSSGAMPDPPPNLSLPIQPVQYNTGYNSDLPFGTNNGSVTTIDPTTGLATFFAPNSGNYVVGIEVTERRNGVVLSTIRMDLQIIVLNCPPNNRPTVTSDKGKDFTIEVQEELCFEVSAEDTDGDIVKLEASGPILDGTNGYEGTLATFERAAAERAVSSEFCWTPDCDAARDEPYIVTFKAEDGGCPPKFNYLDVEIYVRPFNGTEELDGPLRVCKFNSYPYTAQNGQPTSSYEWEITGGEIRGDSTGSTISVYWGDVTTGTIRMREISEFGCPGPWTSIDVIIDESPPVPIISGKDTVCIDEVGLNYTVPFVPNHNFEWGILNGTFASTTANEATVANYSNTGFMIYVIQTNETGCSSDTSFINVFVSDPLPTLTGPQTVCPNASNIQYVTENNTGSTYSWNVIGGTQVSGGNSGMITVDWGSVGSGSVEVVETNRFGCVSPTVLVTVEKTYELSANPIVGPDEVCEFDRSVIYNTIPIEGSVFLWNVAGGNQISGDSSNTISVDWGAAGNGKITLQEKAYDLVNDSICLSDTIELDVIIHPKPTADEIMGVVELCQYEDTFDYSLSGFPGSTYEWSINGDTTGIDGQGTSTISVFWDVAGTFTIQVTEISGAGCPGDPVDITVLVNPKPITSPINGPTIICPENADNHTYSVTNNPTSTFNWSVFGDNTFTGQGSNEIVVNWETSLPNGRLEVLEISDKGCPGDTQTLDIEIDRLAIDLRYVSVGDPDNQMIIDWMLLEDAQPELFTIEKRVDNGAWQEIATVDGNLRNYTETDINTDINPFTYRIKATNKCGTDIYSEEHTNILLQGVQNENFDINVLFTAYNGWDNGVRNYDLYESINFGAYVPKEINVIQGDNTLIPNNPDQFRKCYRVRAFEEGGQFTESWSNEICFTFEPQVFVPNAFTANNDELNDVFGVKAIAINEYSIKIYNRWGEKLFESDDIDEDWIPIYQNKPVPMGTYMYIIQYSDFEDNLYTKSGTINLIR